MDRTKRTIAAVDLLLILPAVLFMTSLIGRRLQPLQYEPARTAEAIVTWYAGRMWTLWLLLIGLPLVVLLTGCATLLGTWLEVGKKRGTAAGRLAGTMASDPATLAVAATTIAAGAILAIVGLHVGAN